MLVLVPGKVVDTVHVSPVDNSREVILRDLVPSVRGGLDLTTFEDGFLDTASTGGWCVVDGSINTVVSRLREGIDSGVVQWVVLLGLGGLMPDSLGPGVLGSGPGAVALNGDVVGASADAEETILTPVGAPGVPDQPVWAAILLTVTDDGDVVDNVQVAGSVAVNSTSVVIKGLGHSDTASDGTSLVDLLHHVLFAIDMTEFINAIDHVLVWHEAGLTWVAVAANVHGRADLAVVQTLSAVDGASLIGDFVISHVFEGVVSLTTVAAIVLGLT